MIKNCFIVSLIIILFACSNQKDKVVINLSDEVKKESSELVVDSLPKLKVAVSAMISPSETFSYYEELFNYLSKKMGRSIEFMQRKTYGEVNEMLIRNQIDVAFICSGAYVKGNDDIDLLVAPVCDGKPLYQAYILVSSSSAIKTFDELKGKKFAFTDPLSNTGKMYAEKRIKELGSTSELFFSKTMYTHAHDISIELVSKNIVDGASVDGLIYEYIKRNDPEYIKNVRIIEKSEYYGIPPVVTPKGIDIGLKDELKSLFLSMHDDPDGKKILDNISIEKFTVVNDSIYDSVRACSKYLKE